MREIPLDVPVQLGRLIRDLCWVIWTPLRWRVPPKTVIPPQTFSESWASDDGDMLPQTRNTLVLRTDFRDDSAWAAVCREIGDSSCEGFVEQYTFVSDPLWSDVPTERLTQFVKPPYFYLVVDRQTIDHPEHPVLAVDLDEKHRNGIDSRRTFRLVPAEVTAFACNLNIANMDFWEFAESVDPDGIFRGFKAP